MLARSLARSGDRVAVRAHGQVRTHAALLAGAARFAHGLAGRGLRPGDRVALIATDRVEAVEAYLGCFLGGFVAVHVNDRLTAAEIRPVLTDAEPAAVVYSPDVPALPDLEDDLRGTLTVSLGERLAGGHLALDVLTGPASSTVPYVPRQPGDLAIVGYTSGTTGRPKGVMHTQLAMLRVLRHMPVHFDLRMHGRCAFPGTLSFVSPLWGVLLPHLYLGGEISFLAGLDPDEWFTRMLTEGSTSTVVPTPLAASFVEQVRRRPQVLDTLRSVVHSGSAMPVPRVHELVDALGARFIEAYGMTETGAPVTRTDAADWTSACQADDVWASTGRVAHIAEVTVLGPDGAALPAGATGEIAVRSETRFAGYLGRPDLTAEAVVDGTLRTGDIGRLDAAGYLYVTDRAKDMVVSGGMNVFPAEVEAALVDLPGLREIAVFGVPDERWGETVVAVVVRGAGPDLDEAAVVRAARQRIASYKRPTAVRFAAALPRTASLKVDKPELRRRWAAGLS